MGQGGSMMQLPSGAHRDLLPLILPLLPSAASTPLSPADVPSLAVSEPPAAAGWPVAMTIIPERKEEKRSRWNARQKREDSVLINR